MTNVTGDELARDIKDFLAFKHALCYPYTRGEATLRSFYRFVQCELERCLTKQPTIALEPAIQSWLSRVEGRKAVTISLDLGVVRQLCRYRRRRHPGAFVPEHAYAPQTESVYSPYIFSHKEVQQLITAAKRHQGRNIWAAMLHLLLLTLYCTGLRFGEAVRLRLSDVNLKQCRFAIRESKGRSRLVPFGPDLAREINTYLEKRTRITVDTECTGTDAFFIRLDGSPLTIGAASEAVRRLLRKQGLKPTKGRIGPRPYDFRHAYAVHRLTDWYRQGVDVHARLPWLSAYMGHLNVLGTEVYLHATPELLQLASNRFEQRYRRPGPVR
jgi:integrase